MLRPARKAVRAFVGSLLQVVHGKATPAYSTLTVWMRRTAAQAKGE
jgi:hypothetical protein